jgi:hypothetical protein
VSKQHTNDHADNEGNQGNDDHNSCVDLDHVETPYNMQYATGVDQMFCFQGEV